MVGESVIPTGFDPVAAGTGTDGIYWGEDSFGSVEPFVLLGPAGEAADLVVSLTGYSGYEGQLSQAALGYPEKASFDERQLDGEPAILTKTPDHLEVPMMTDLVVRHDEETAVRVRTMGEATYDELAAIAETVEVPERLGESPSLTDIPEDREVKGSLTSDAALAAGAFVGASGAVPGPMSAHGLGWERHGEGPSPTELAVVTMPGRAGDRSAVPGINFLAYGNPEFDEPDVAGRTATVVFHEQTEDWSQRSLAVSTEWGDLLFVVSSGADPLSTEQLVAIASSVSPIDSATWEAQVEQFYGGPGLHPDEGSVEVARGTVGDLEWLAQTFGTNKDRFEDNPLAADGPLIDTCLKLSNRKVACARGLSTGGQSGSLDVGRAHEPTPTEPFIFPSFLVLNHGGPATRAVISYDDGKSQSFPLENLGSTGHVGGVLIDLELDHFMPTCRDFPADGEFGEMRFARIDLFADDTHVECIGVD